MGCRSKRLKIKGKGCNTWMQARLRGERKVGEVIGKEGKAVHSYSKRKIAGLMEEGCTVQ
jgi:hypothetical protein